MVTKITIEQWFRDFAENHTQITGFGYGYKSDISASEAERYCLMWVLPQPCTIDGNELTYNYNVYFADRTQDGRGNALDVESDTHQKCLDLLAALNYETNTEWQLVETATITNYIEDGKDRVDGNWVNIGLRVAFDYDECAIPVISPPIPPPSVVCEPATVIIKDSLGATLATEEIASGITEEITINDSSAFAKNSENTTIASATDIPAEGSKDIAIPDTPYTVKNQLNITYASGNLVSGKSGQVIDIVTVGNETTIYAEFANIATNDISITISDRNSGTYTSISDDGASGSITLNHNGGGFVAFSSPLVLADTDTLIIRRSITTAAGWVELTGTF